MIPRQTVMVTLACLYMTAAACNRDHATEAARPTGPEAPEQAHTRGSSTGEPRPPTTGATPLWSRAELRTTRPCADMQAADLDGDGDQDVAAVAKLDAGKTDVYVLRNGGDGRFKGSVVHSFASVRSQNTADVCTLTLSDVDGDGDVDILFGAMEVQGNRFDLHVLKNDGKGSFALTGSTARGSP